MAKNLLTDALNAISNGTFNQPAQSVQTQAAMQPVLPSAKESQINDATQRITSGFADKGLFPTLSGEIQRLNTAAADRENVLNQSDRDSNDYLASTADLTSASPLRRIRANALNAGASVAASVGKILLQNTQAPNVASEIGILGNATDAERAAFNREQERNKVATGLQTQKNALTAIDILSGTDANKPVANTLTEALKNLPAQSVEDKELLDRKVDSASNTSLGIPQYPGMPVNQGTDTNVRDRLQRAQDLQTATREQLGNPAEGIDNAWGTEAMVNRSQQQEIAQRLEEENKGRGILSSIGNTIGEYLSNPGVVVQTAAETLPYALGTTGILAGTLGQAVQNQSDANTERGKGGLPTRDDVEASLGWNALDSGLNFAENLINARAISGISNAGLTAPLQRGVQSLADTALGRAAANTVARSGVSRVTAPVASVLASEPVRNIATTMAVNGLTGAAQNQIETRNLLGKEGVDTQGNINAGVLGALSAGVLAAPPAVAVGGSRAISAGVRSARDSVAARVDANNPQAAEARKAAADSVKPYEDLTNPESSDYNPQAAIRQQVSVYADSNATPEAKELAATRAKEVRDNAEKAITDIREEIGDIQKNAAALEATEGAVKQLTDAIQNDPEHPQTAQRQALLDQYVQRRDELAAKQYTEEQQANLVNRYQQANANAEAIRTSYDRFANAAGLNTRVETSDIQNTVDTANSESATTEQVNAAADHVVSHPMQYSPEQLRTFADDNTNRFSDSQRDAIRALADARIAQNEVKTNLTVNQDIIQGGKGYRSLGDYTTQFADAVRKGNMNAAENLRDGLSRFQQSHEQKLALAKQLLESGQNGQIIRANNSWTLNTGKKLNDADLRRNGGLNIHRNSTRLVSSIETEVAAIQATAKALDTIAAARPAATANATQPSSQPVTEAQVNAETASAQAKPEQAAVEAEPVAEVKTKNIESPNRRTSDDLKMRTQKQQAAQQAQANETRVQQPDATTDAESDPALQSSSDTDSSVTTDATVATDTAAQVKADGAVSVLRPEGKSLEAARTEELQKPFAEQNLVLTGFAQTVREGHVNPLVTVPDFMANVIKKANWTERFTEVNRFLAKPMTPEQKAQIGMFAQFHDKVSKDLDKAINPKKAEYRYQDFAQYLLNAEGKFDENTKAALTASMFSWLSENGNKLMVTPDDLAAMLHIDKADITTATYNRLSEIGSSQRAVAQSLGQRAYQMLGLKVLKDVDPNRAGRMQQALGMYAMHAMMKRGYLEQTTMSATEYFNHMTDGFDPEARAAKAKEFSAEYLNGKSLKDAKLTFNFVRVPRAEVNGKLVSTPLISKIVEANKNTQGVMSKLFSFDSSKVNPLTAKPGKFMQPTVGDFNQQVSTELAQRLTKAQQQPYRVNESVTNTVSKLITADRAALEHMMGVRTVAETPFMHERERKGQDAKNADVQRALDNAYEFIGSLAKDDTGRLQAVYMPLSVWSNNRVGVASNTLNPQGNKVHRILAGMEAHETSIATNQAPIDAEGNVTDFGRFLLTVAQGMEEAPIRTGDNGKMPTVDKVTAGTYLQGMQNYLASEKVRSGIDSMINLIDGEPTSKDIGIVKDLVEEFGMGPQSFSALHSLALHEKAVRNGDDAFSVAIGGESDGVTNGPILTNILYGTADKDLLARGGLYTADAGVTNVPQYRERGGQDYYQLLGEAQNNFWDQFYPRTEGKPANLTQAYRRAIDYLAPGFGTRKKAKVLATPFNYGSGLDSLKRASGRDAIDSIYSHISGIAEAYSRSTEEGDQYKSNVEKAINIVLKMAAQERIANVTFKGLGKAENLLSYELPKNVEHAIMAVEMATRGAASEEAINQVAANYIETRDANTAISNAAYQVDRVLSNRLEAQRLKAALDSGEVGSRNGVAVEGLSTTAKATLNAEMRDYSAVIPTATGYLSSNPKESGYVAAKSSTRFDTNNLETEVNGFFAEAANPADTGLSGTKANTFRSYTSGAQVRDKAAPGVSTSALVVQGTDAAISTKVISDIAAQNFHDANMFGIKDIVKGAQIQNKAMWDAVTGYDSQLANTTAMMDTYRGVVNMKDVALTASDFKAVDTSLRQLSIKHGLTSKLTDPVSAESTLAYVVQSAYGREIQKLQTLRDIEYVNQYGYEGGEYQVTAADRKAIDKKISKFDTDMKKAVADARELGKTLDQRIKDGTNEKARAEDKAATVERRQAVEQAAAESEAAQTPRKQNALERFLLNNKEGKVDPKQLMKFVSQSLAQGKTDGSAMQNRMRTTYAEIAKVLTNALPANLEVNIISGESYPESVQGLDKNLNSRAWFYSDSNHNQINIKMLNDEAPNLELVMHEMLHAATARALDNTRRNPKDNPEVTKVLERMTDLQQRIKTKVDSSPIFDEFKRAVVSVDEFISYGMTNPKFQQFLDHQTGIKLNGRSRNNLVTAFREFATNVLNAVYAMTGRKPSKRELTATEALIMDTSELLQKVTTPVSDSSLSLPMANGAAAAQAVARYTHRQVFDSLANSGGKQNSPEFSNNLGRVIDTVSDKLFSQIRGDHLTSQESYSPGQVWADALINGKAPYTTKALAAGFRMTDQEAFAIESLETAISASLNSGFGSAVNRELRKTWEAARNKVEPKDFHEGNWSTATQAEKDAAQAKWDHLFKLEASQTGVNRYLAQFAAMTIGHEQTSQLMGFTTREPASNNRNLSTFEKVSGYASHAYNMAAGLLSRTNEGQLVNQKAQVLAQQLVTIDLKNRDKSVGKLDQAFNLIENATDKVSEAVLRGVNATADTKLIRESRFGIVRLAGSTTRLVAKRNLDSLGETIRQLRDMNSPNQADGWAAQILSDIQRPDKVRSAFESLQRHSNLIEQRRRNLSEITRSNVMEQFQDSGKYLTNADKEAMSYTLLRTDAHSLLDSYGMSDVQKFVTNGAARRKEIGTLQQSVITDPNGNDMIIRAKALGYYMATGKATIAGMAKNAQAIASGAGTHYNTTTIADKDSPLVQSIDTLASLYALEYSKPEHLKRTAEVMKREMANPENGIKAMLNTHKVLTEDSKSTLFADNEISRIKGYIPEVTNPYRDVQVVEQGSAEASNLEAMGYQAVGNVPVDPNIKGAGVRVMYATQDNGSQRYVSGATSLTSNHRKGTSAVDRDKGQTVEAAARATYAAVQKRKTLNHAMFNPAEVKTTFAIPVLGTDGRIMDFQYEMQNANRDVLLDRNHDFAHLLGQYAGQSFDKMHSPSQNSLVMGALHEDFQSNYARSPERYVEIGPNASNERSREIWRMLPEQTRMEAESIWGAGNPMLVRSDLVNLVFGFRKFSIGTSFDKDPAERNQTERFITGIAEAVLGDKAKLRTVQGERGVQEVMSFFRDVIVIRNVTTLMRNQMGNFTLLKAYGVPASDIVKDTKLALQAGLSYRKNTAMLLKLQQQQRAGLGDFDKLEQQIIQIEDQLARNPIRDFIDEGMMPSIVDDVDTTDNSYTYASGLARRFEGVTDRIPASVRTAAKWSFVTKDTPVHKFLSNSAQFSDFTSKYVLYKHAVKNMSHQEALQRAADAFVNYDVPTSKELQYMNDMGMLMFTKYRLRIQRAMLTLMKERPGSVLAQSALVARFTGAPSALEPNLITGVGNPLSSSVLQVPSALDQPFPIRLMDMIF
ncbi:virion-associated RNA polymerase [Erwinia phage MIF8]